MMVMTMMLLLTLWYRELASEFVRTTVEMETAMGLVGCGAETELSHAAVLEGAEFVGSFGCHGTHFTNFGNDDGASLAGDGGAGGGLG